MTGERWNVTMIIHLRSAVIKNIAKVLPCNLIYHFLKEIQEMEEKTVMMGYDKSRCTQPFTIEFFSNSSAWFFFLFSVLNLMQN